MPPALHPLVLRGREALQRGDMRAVEAAAEERLKTAGRDINALELRFIVQQRRGQFGQAARTLDAVIGIDSKADWAYNELVQLFMTHGKPEDAEKVARAALRANPRNAHAHNLFGMILSERNDLPSSEWHLRSALELSSPQAPLLMNLGLNLMKQGRMDEADRCFAQAHELDPRDMKTLACWSTFEDERGNAKRAEELLNLAEAASSAADVNLLRANHLARTARYTEALAILEAAGELSSEALLARGAVHDALGNSNAAWHDFVAGKVKLLKASPGAEYRAEGVDSLFERCKRFFSRETVELLPRAKRRPDTAQPIFILGFPRSGSALVEQVLSRHPAITAGGDPPFTADLNKLAGHLFPGSERFPENLAHSWMADYHHAATVFRDYYLARAEQQGLLKNGGYFTARMAFSEIYLPLIKMAFPEAKIITMVRHPLDVCVSMMANTIADPIHCGYRIEDTVHHLNATFDLLEHYRSVLGLDDFVLKYETLIGEAATAIPRTLEYLGLPPDRACLGAKLHVRSINRFRRYEQHLRPHIGRLDALMKAHGYAV